MFFLGKAIEFNKNILNLDLGINNLGNGNERNITVLGKAIEKNSSIVHLKLVNNDFGSGQKITYLF